jgi:hypothetical protein
MTPYPDNYGAEPTCSTCLYFFPVVGKTLAPVCALKQQPTSPENACVKWALWVAKAKPNSPNNSPN